MKIKEKRILVALVCGAMSLSYNFASVSAAADTTTSQNQMGGVQTIRAMIVA